MTFRVLARKLSRARIVPLTDGLRIEFGDVSARRVHVALDEQALTTWRERLHA